MGSFYKFFPFLSLFSFDENTLTAWWVALTIAYFLISLVLLYNQINTIIKNISPHHDLFSLEEIEENNYLRRPWGDYRQTFLSLASDRQKTSTRAENYFNFQKIIGQFLNLRYWQAVPGMLVGLGILGTFVGLTVGIAGFELGNEEQIKDSIKILLSGMGTAFVSSVWGMLLSLVFGISEKQWFKKVNRISNSLCSFLDDRFLLSKAEEIKIIKEDQEEVFRRFFAYLNENDEEVLLGYIFRDLKKEAEQQTKALKSFSTDLADGIRISSETIGALGHNIADAIKTPINSELAPLLEKIEAAVQEVRQAKEESSGELISGVMNDLQDALAGMGAQFHDSLAGSVSAQIESLAGIINQAGNSLSHFPNQLHSMMEGLESQIGQLRAILNDSSQTVCNTMDNKLRDVEQTLNRMVEQIQQGISEQQQLIQNTCSTAYRVSEETIQRIGTESNNATENFRAAIESLQKNMTELLSRQQETTSSVQDIITNSQEVFDRGSTLISAMNDTLQSVKGNLSHFQQLSQNMTTSSDNLRLGLGSLQEGMRAFKQQSDSVTQQYNSSFQRIEESLKSAETVSSNYASRFSTINEGLQGIFSEIQTGLTHYQETTRESLNKYLSEFATQLTGAVESLRGGIEELQEIVDELAETKGSLS